MSHLSNHDILMSNLDLLSRTAATAYVYIASVHNFTFNLNRKQTEYLTLAKLLTQYISHLYLIGIRPPMDYLFLEATSTSQHVVCNK